MHTSAYEYVLAVAKYRSISKAAYALSITQPALTKFLNRLEEDLQIKLFDRSVSPIVITPAGEKFVEKASMIMELESSLKYDLNRISSGTTGEVIVGMNTEFCGNNLPYVLPEFRFRYPDINVKILEGHNRFLFQKLEQEEVDIVYAAYSRYAESFIYDPMYEEAIILAVPVSHPLVHSLDLANNSPLSPYYLNPEKIRGCDFLCLIPEQGMGAIAKNLFHKYNLNPNIVLKVSKHETALRLASTGMGMIFTPVRTPLRIPLVKPMAYFSIENPLVTRSRGVYYSKYTPLSDAAKYFINVFNDVYEHESAIRTPVCQLLFHPDLT